MAQVHLNDPFAHGVPSPDKLKVQETALSELKSQIIAQDKQISGKQTTKLKDFIRQLQDIKKKLEVMRKQCQVKNSKLKSEIDLLESKLHGFQIGAKNLEMESKIKVKIAGEEKSFLRNCEKRIQIAESINYKKLRQLEIEQRRSLANEVFKWILVAIYVQPENKFYFLNFKEQVIDNQEGSFDLKERLGKFDAYHAKEEQRVKTVKFLEYYQKIRAAPELKNFEDEIDKIHQIAKLFLECNDIGKRVKGYQREIEDSRKNILKEDEGLVQSRKECDALSEKYRLSQLYLLQLNKIEQSFAEKLQKYNKQVELAQYYVNEISSITQSKIISLGPKAEIQKRQYCECTIF